MVYETIFQRSNQAGECPKIVEALQDVPWVLLPPSKSFPEGRRVTADQLCFPNGDEEIWEGCSPLPPKLLDLMGTYPFGKMLLLKLGVFDMHMILCVPPPVQNYAAQVPGSMCNPLVDAFDDKDMWTDAVIQVGVSSHCL